MREPGMINVLSLRRLENASRRCLTTQFVLLREFELIYQSVPWIWLIRWEKRPEKLLKYSNEILR